MEEEISKATQEEPEPVVEKPIDLDRELMKRMDWRDSDLYDAFKESRESRKPIEQVLKSYAAMRTINGDLMYTDVELQYFM